MQINIPSDKTEMQVQILLVALVVGHDKLPILACEAGTCRSDHLRDIAQLNRASPSRLGKAKVKVEV